MPYGFIVLAAGTGLVLYFIFATEASLPGKAVVSVLFIFSFASSLGWIPVSPLIGLFLLVALGIFIIFYRIYQDAMSGK